MIRKQEILFGTRKELEEYFSFVKSYTERTSIIENLRDLDVFYCEIDESNSIKKQLDKCKEKIAPVIYLEIRFKDNQSDDKTDSLLLSIESKYAFISEEIVKSEQKQKKEY